MPMNTMFVIAAVSRELAREVARLIEDLGRGQVAREAGLTGRAKRARVRAAGLARDADRVAVAVVLHEDGLDFVAVVQAEEALRRLSVARMLDHDGRDRFEMRSLLGAEFGPQLLGQTVTSPTSATSSLVAAR